MAGLARLDLLPPVVMYDEHWANIVLAGADGVEGGGGGTRPDRRSIDLPHFVTLCRRALPYARAVRVRAALVHWHGLESKWNSEIAREGGLLAGGGWCTTF